MKAMRLLLIMFLEVSVCNCIAKNVTDFIDSGKDPIVKLYKNTRLQYPRMLIVNPDGHKAGGKRPAVVWIHGGGWTSGCPEQFIAHCRWTASRGAVGIAISYRLLHNPDCDKQFLKGPSISESVDDCRAAVRYIREYSDELGIDPGKIAVIGDSAGGHLALCLGTLDGPVDSGPNAIINCNGISNMAVGPWIKFIKPQKNEEDRIKMAKSLSPLYHLEKVQGPILTMNGGKDNVVKPEDSEAFHKACLAAGIDSEYILWPDARHAFILTGYTATDDQINQAMLAINRFLVKHDFFNNNTMTNN